MSRGPRKASRRAMKIQHGTPVHLPQLRAQKTQLRATGKVYVPGLGLVTSDRQAQDLRREQIRRLAAEQASQVTITGTEGRKA